jgi:hypothetical protein
MMPPTMERRHGNLYPSLFGGLKGPAYPPLTRVDIQACMAHAADLAHEEVLPLAEAQA